MSSTVELATRRYNVLKFPIAAVAVCLALYTALIYGEIKWFSGHPVLMIFAVYFCAPLAVLLKKIGGIDNTIMHGNLLFTGLISMLGGQYIIYTNKDMLGKEHFTTWHSVLGRATLLSWFMVDLAGFIFFHPHYGLKSTRQNKTLRFIHKYGGKFSLILAASTCFIGFSTIESDVWKQGALAAVSIGFAPFIIL